MSIVQNQAIHSSCVLDVHKDSIYLCILSYTSEVFDNFFAVSGTLLAAISAVYTAFTPPKCRLYTLYLPHLHPLIAASTNDKCNRLISKRYHGRQNSRHSWSNSYPGKPTGRPYSPTTYHQASIGRPHSPKYQQKSKNIAQMVYMCASTERFFMEKFVRTDKNSFLCSRYSE